MSCASAECSPATDSSMRSVAIVRSGPFGLALRVYIPAGFEVAAHSATFRHDEPQHRPVTPLTWLV
jgi:hypothetical protein